MFKILGLVTIILLLLTTKIKPKSVTTLLGVAAYPIIKPNKNIIKITDELYLSDYAESLKYEDLKQLGIKQILSVGVELPEHETTDFKLKHIKIDDRPSVDIQQYFEEAHNFIDQGRTLVHCYAGISRSVTIVISYLMRNGLDYESAYNYVKSRRPIANPNKGFKKQLIKFENYLKSNK
jgi:atypical dual specificity phosphatase